MERVNYKGLREHTSGATLGKSGGKSGWALLTIDIHGARDLQTINVSLYQQYMYLAWGAPSLGAHRFACHQELTLLKHSGNSEKLFHSSLCICARMMFVCNVTL